MFPVHRGQPNCTLEAGGFAWFSVCEWYTWVYKVLREECLYPQSTVSRQRSITVVLASGISDLISISITITMAEVLLPPVAPNGYVVTEKAHPNVVTKEEFLRPDFEAPAMKKIASESILLAGGAYAVLLQMGSASPHPRNESIADKNSISWRCQRR